MTRLKTAPRSARKKPKFVLLKRRQAAGSSLSSSQKKQRGQATLEYALLIFLMAVFAIGFNTTFVQFLNKGIVRFNAVLEKELRSGGFNEASGLWEN